MRNRTPTKGIKAGDFVRPTGCAVEELGIFFTCARVVAVKKHEVNGRREPSLVLVTYQTQNNIVRRDALHETWLEKVA